MPKLGKPSPEPAFEIHSLLVTLVTAQFPATGYDPISQASSERISILDGTNAETPPMLL
jgi:hypothetical protein